MRETAAVVVTYNRKQLLSECLMHLQNQKAPLDIIVVDNAGTDGTGDLFTAPPDNIHYFNTGTNLGGAGGFNYGIRKAYELGYKYIWVMDDDSMPQPDALTALLNADNNLGGNYGFLSSKVLWTDGSICNMNIQKITKWKRLKSFDEIQAIQYASFVSLFLTRDTIRQFGLPYKEFFIWSDDWEFTRRISKHLKSYFIPQSTVEHKCASNVGADIVDSPADRIDRFRYLYRNDVVLYRQDGIDGFFYMLLRIAKHSLKVLLKSDNKCGKIKLIFSALSEGRNFHPAIEYPEE